MPPGDHLTSHTDGPKQRGSLARELGARRRWPFVSSPPLDDSSEDEADASSGMEPLLEELESRRSACFHILYYALYI